jgi:hypothetical protein
MTTLLELSSGDPRFDAFPANLVTPGHPPRDARLFLALGPDGTPLARCAALWNGAMHLPDGETPGLVGWFAAKEGAPIEASRAVLDAAVDALRADHGAHRVVGPLDFSTWDAYRLALPEAGPLRFLPDVNTPPHYPALFEAAGFSRLADYTSTALVPDPATWPRLDRAAARFAARGIRVDRFDPAHAERDLLDIFAVARVAFTRAFLYTPISEEGFLSRYRPVVPRIVPEFVRIARNASNAPVGFVFALPNPLAPADAPELVIKTLAVLPDPAVRGLGAGLTELIHKLAWNSGIRTVYHALMHEANDSANITADAARVVRRYRLFFRKP